MYYKVNKQYLSSIIKYIKGTIDLHKLKDMHFAFTISNKYKSEYKTSTETLTTNLFNNKVESTRTTELFL